MRYFFILYMILLSGCVDDNFSAESTAIEGSWRLNSYKISAGGPLPDDFTETDFFEEFTFFNGQNYMLKRETEETTTSYGTYTIKDNQLILRPLEGVIENEFSYSFELSTDILILFPSGPTICIEGCLYRYIRVD